MATYVVIMAFDKRGIPEYRVVNKQNGCVLGQFDCEKWAQEFADELNRRYSA